MNKPLAFPSQPNTPIVGQPFTLKNLWMPVSCVVQCNCIMPSTDITIVNSAPATCPHCQKSYSVAFNPQNG